MVLYELSHLEIIFSVSYNLFFFLPFEDIVQFLLQLFNVDSLSSFPL